MGFPLMRQIAHVLVYFIIRANVDSKYTMMNNLVLNLNFQLFMKC